MSDSVAAGTSGTEPTLIVLPDPESVAAAAAGLVAETLHAAGMAHGRVDFATTGGSTPVAIYPHLARDPLRALVPWERLRLWWSDDRFVPRDHPLSNVQPAESVLLRVAAWSGESGQGVQGDDIDAGLTEGVWLSPDTIHPFPCTEAIARGVGPQWCAATYDALLRAAGPRQAGDWPVFDLMLLGLGPDGHIMSVFPGSDTFDSPAWAAAVPAPTHVEPHLPRVTLTPGVLRAAERVLVVTTGAAKADVVARIFADRADERALPGRLARRRGATWILDEAAAAGLARRQ
ncbi:MAG: 6-phosphogluconolactonase [Chloroflexi bacterium]|nr:6-phosphogluconolactonase [Chloroflexota bacterium]